METILALLSFIPANFATIVTAILGLATAMLALAMLIPGDQPDKFLQSAVDFLTKFSKK